MAVSGNTVVAGAPGATVNGNDGQGAAYVFVKAAGGWASETEAAELTASDGAAGDQLGFSVAVSGDTVVAGAPYADGERHHRRAGGGVRVRQARGRLGRETQTAELTASDGAADGHLGFSVAVSGKTVVSVRQSAATRQGAAYVFVKPAGGWASETQAAKLTASDGAVDDSRQLGGGVGQHGRRRRAHRDGRTAISARGRRTCSSSPRAAGPTRPRRPS